MHRAVVFAAVTLAIALPIRIDPFSQAAPPRQRPLRDRVQTYLLGVIVRLTTPVGRAWGHSGFFPGYQTELWHFPDAGVTLAIQINSSAPRSTGPRGLVRGLYDIAAMVTQ